MPERPYIQHGRRHGPGGSDPIPMLINDWMTTHNTLSVPDTGSATNFPYTAIDYQTDDGSVYAPLAGTVASIEIKQVGSYLVRSMFQFPGGVTGTAQVNANIAGDCTTYPHFDYSGVQTVSVTNGAGAYIVWEQLVTVNDLTAPTGVYNVVQQQITGAARNVTAYLQIFRYT